jgi:hypothetical protein
LIKEHYTVKNYRIDLILFKNTYRPFQVNCNFCQPDLLRFLWHSESFKQKTDNYILVKPKNLPQKNYRVANFSRFLHHTFFDNSTSFYCKNLCLGALERLNIELNSKNKKTNNNNFFQKKFWFRWLEVELLKMQFFQKSKEITIEQQLYDVCLVEAVCGCWNFFFIDF